MTNKEFQNILASYPDDYIICMDNVFGWETTHNMIDPHLYVNTDIRQIEIEPDKYRTPWKNPKKELPENGEECIVLIDDTIYVAIYWNYDDNPIFKAYSYFTRYNTLVSLCVDEITAWMQIPDYEPEDE